MTQSEAAPAAEGAGDLFDELRIWLRDNWDPDLTVREWWERLGMAGWSAPSLPGDAYGRGLSRADAVQVAQVIADFGALGAPGGLGRLLAAPTIATHGTREQIDTYVQDIVTGRKGWCQLFSEPGAGSDLAGLQTRAVKDGEGWVVNGQKVWTSGGHLADLGMLLARTDPDVPKHQGITYFAFDMLQPGVDVRPLREMTGRALFNEVFLTDARVPDAAVIGEVNRGWVVANSTLAFERAGLGSGSGGGAGGAAGLATPGTVVGDLDRRAGDFVEGRGRRSGRGGRRGAARAGEGTRGDGAGGKEAGGKEAGGKEAGGDGRRSSEATDTEAEMVRAMRGGAGSLAELARRVGKGDDALLRQGLAELHIWNELGRMNTLRHKAVRAAGGDVPGMPNIAKLSMSHIMRLSRDLGLEILGAAGMLHGYDDESRRQLAGIPVDPGVNAVTELALLAQGPSIYGGTDQIQRNIIGERVLGLPKEPNNDRTTPFSQLPKNA